MTQPTSQALRTPIVSRLGGGGYLTGVLTDPFDDERLYARCDVAGVFRSDDGGAHWRPRNAGLTAVHTHMVQALAASPHHPGVLLRCSGDARAGRTYGSVHRTDDGGDTWTETHTGADFYGNGPTRMYGEACAFDPHTPGLVLAGAYSTGMWRSADDGVTWERTGLVGERVGCVLFHPASPGLVYAGTVSDPGLDGLAYLGDLPLEAKLREHGDRPRGTPGRLWVSEDAGVTWTVRHERRHWSVGGIAADAHDPRVLLVCGHRGVFRSRDGGRSFTPCDLGQDTGRQCDTVCADPHRPGRYLTAAHDGRRAFPLYESRDHGATWAPVKETYTDDDLRDYPDHLRSVHGVGRAISAILPHPRHPDTLFVTGYFGVSRSDDAGRTWSAQGFRGAESTCVQSLRADPHDADLPDRGAGLWRSDDTGRTWRKAGNPFTGTSVLPADRDWIDSEFLPVVVYQRGNAVGTGQHLRYDPFRAGRLVAAEWTTGVRLSTDGGVTWGTPVASGLPELGGTTVLTGVEPDPVVPGRWWASTTTRGVWRSDDGAATWRPVLETLPAGGPLHAASVCARGDRVVVAVEPMPRPTDGPPALLVSEDGGGSWTDAHDPALGAVRWRRVVLDGAGRAHAGACGNGVVVLAGAGAGTGDEGAHLT